MGKVILAAIVVIAGFVVWKYQEPIGAFAAGFYDGIVNH
jgi:hypothetical protein